MLTDPAAWRASEIWRVLRGLAVGRAQGRRGDSRDARPDVRPERVTCQHLPSSIAMPAARVLVARPLDHFGLRRGGRRWRSWLQRRRQDDAAEAGQSTAAA